MPQFTNIRLSGVVLCTALLLVSCRDDALVASADRSVTVMTFNVENLFDTADDANRNDETYLPLAQKQSKAHKAKCARIAVKRWRNQCLDWDWNEAALKIKLERVAAAILQLNNGRGPDIIALQEVENLAVLERLRTEYLGAANDGPAILIEGQDIRGIDVAFLTRLPLVGEPKLHSASFEGFQQAKVLDTRGILQADFQLPDGSILSGFAVHFPAPFHPHTMREVAYRHLSELRAALPENRSVFAAGDFNTTSKEIATHDTLAKFVRPNWQIAHELGCSACKGTSYYAIDNTWSFLDMIIFSSPDWQIDSESVALANKAEQQVTTANTPNRFSLSTFSGVSDHWPLVMRIQAVVE